MPTQEDRIAMLEQTMVSRIEFINAVNKFTLQQAQNASDMSHQVTILPGVIGSQGQDIKAIKEDVNILKERLISLGTTVNEHTARFDHLEILLAQILTRLPEKP